MPERTNATALAAGLRAQNTSSRSSTHHPATSEGLGKFGGQIDRFWFTVFANAVV